MGMPMDTVNSGNAGNGNAVGNANLPIGVVRAGAAQESGDPGYPGVPFWHSRGYLPHFESAEATQHVTFHLADSLPAEVVERIEEELRALPAEKRDVERRKRCEEWIDAGHGSCVLREPGVAGMVEGALLFFDAKRYRVLAWVVMPNHVHVLFHPMNGWTVAQIVASWKKFTATRICAFRRASAGAAQESGGPGNANLRIGAKAAPVWHREYWDRYIRNERHLRQAVNYIHQNPVKARLVARAEDWLWGSARRVGGNCANYKDAG